MNSQKLNFRFTALSEVRSRHLAHHEALCTLPRSSIRRTPYIVAGPIVVELKAPTDGSSEGCKAISKQLSKNLREHPSHYYVNVHNNPYPDGAIRGQLHRDM
jgi:hypothetical protein